MPAEPTQVVQDYLECWNEGDVEGLADVVAADVHVTGLPGGMETQGLDAYQAFTRQTLEAFPDLHWTVVDSIATDDRAAAVVTATGTHEGEFFGIPATGREVEMEATLYFAVSDGKITRKWNRADELGLLQQVGVVAEDMSAIASTGT
jgi:steroid delta-isomerase-like uncharacterized protein